MYTAHVYIHVTKKFFRKRFRFVRKVIIKVKSNIL